MDDGAISLARIGDKKNFLIIVGLVFLEKSGVTD
jgi:hypothetical protein